MVIRIWHNLDDYKYKLKVHLTDLSLADKEKQLEGKPMFW